jgi:hypothetical protein
VLVQTVGWHAGWIAAQHRRDVSGGIAVCCCLGQEMARCRAACPATQRTPWPAVRRYVPLFGAQPYDQANEREGDIPFEEQLRGLERVVKAGKVGPLGQGRRASERLLSKRCKHAASLQHLALAGQAAAGLLPPPPPPAHARTHPWPPRRFATWG